MDYIKRETILNALSELKNSMPFMTDKELLETVKKKVEKIPAEDVQEVKRGKWVYFYRFKKFVCLACGYEIKHKPDFKFCPYCGAKMESEE